ncbi:hypothetical protein [Glaciibacter psychrotolerans]|uniref:Uncharacterized protein n=1 Tax=Glaciibacter psychrotolerans TaxID=670054 RepID=A0A7Z0J665_9MICO|nr:hypothetical protein [Leifsonia psychrotolerans]NYJ19624.1 hypothetical protein [Leifsonia psychrotolerans]
MATIAQQPQPSYVVIGSLMEAAAWARAAGLEPTDWDLIEEGPVPLRVYARLSFA